MSNHWPLVLGWCMVCSFPMYWDNDSQSWLPVWDVTPVCRPHVISSTKDGRHVKPIMPKYKPYLQGDNRRLVARVIEHLAIRRKWKDPYIAEYLTAWLGNPVSPSVVANIRSEFNIPAAVRPGRPIGGKP